MFSGQLIDFQSLEASAYVSACQVLPAVAHYYANVLQTAEHGRDERYPLTLLKRHEQK